MSLAIATNNYSGLIQTEFTLLQEIWTMENWSFSSLHSTNMQVVQLVGTTLQAIFTQTLNMDREPYNSHI